MVLSILLGLFPRKISLKYWLKPIDNTVLSMVNYYQMDDVHTLLVDLKTKGWTNASIADAIGVTVNAVEKWQAGDRNSSQSHLILLNQLIKKKPPKKRRYARGSRPRSVR
jgi:DNA-binding transcriptional regulator YiaG